MSLASYIATIVRCTLCTAEGVGSCDCWITLRCPRCERERLDERQPFDPAGDVVEVICPACTSPTKGGDRG